MANNIGANGPRVGASTGRSRNTLVNLSSHQTSTAMPGGLVPPVSPSSAVGYGSQTAAAQYGYFAQLAALKQQRAALTAGFRAASAGIHNQQLADVAHAANSAMDRGLAGSSIDLAGRAQAHTDAATALAAARQEKAMGLLGIQTSRLGAGADLYMTLANIEAQRRAEQAGLAVDAYANNTYDAAQTDYAALYRQALQQIRDQQSGRTPRTRSGLEPLPNWLDNRLATGRM